MRYPDPLAPEVVRALKEVATRAERTSRDALWALEACDEDAERAATALMDATRVERARRSMEYTRSNDNTRWADHWESVLQDRQRLLARGTNGPRLLEDRSRWIHERLELAEDQSEIATDARKVGTRAYVDFVHREGRDPLVLANLLTLAIGMFPIDAEDWEHVSLAQAEADLAYVIGHDLAYRRKRRNGVSAHARARRFIGACGDGATILTNSEPIAPPLAKSGRGWSSVSVATFDWAIVVVGEARAGIAVFTGED